MTARDRVGMQLRDRPEFKSKPRPVTFPKETMVTDAVAEMARRNIGAVIVTDADGRVGGVVTERDIMVRIVNAGRDAKVTTLEDIMTREVRVAQETDDVLDWMRTMSNERFRRLPVVDADGRVVAVFTQGDFVSYTWPDLWHQAKQLAAATVARSYGIWLVLGGVFLYTLLMVVVLRLL
ncbi:MAG: CBS domain-containing protein [Alkalilacustris sp.]